MKTLEIFQYSGKNFRRKSDGLTIEITEDGRFAYIQNWVSGCMPLDTNDEWEEVKKPVTWQEAFKAGLQGKRIKPVGQHVTFPYYGSLLYVFKYLLERPGYFEKVMLDDWYVE